jgi:hypothetical protein
LVSAWEKFFAATLKLASAGPIKQRLLEAFTAYLSDVEQDELPKEIRGDFSALAQSLEQVRPMRGENAIQATVRKMSDDDAARYSRQIVSMLGSISRMHMQTRQPVLRAVSGGDD